jgi:ankyrin repeat protein
MTMLTMRTAIAACMIAVAGLSAPAAAQFSDSYKFFKAVKEKNAADAIGFIASPGSTVLTAREGDSGDQALHIVTRRRDIPWMNLMLTRGAPVDGRDREGNSALIIAASTGFVDGVRVLLANKANVNASNNAGETALIKAVQARDITTVRVLLDAGANPKLTDHVAGMSARDYAAQDRRNAAILKVIEESPVKPAPTGIVGPR